MTDMLDTLARGAARRSLSRSGGRARGQPRTYGTWHDTTDYPLYLVRRAGLGSRDRSEAYLAPDRVMAGSMRGMAASRAGIWRRPCRSRRAAATDSAAARPVTMLAVDSKTKHDLLCRRQP